MMALIIIFSLSNLAFLLLFIRWEICREKRLLAILQEYRDLKKRTESYILSPGAQAQFKKYDEYFERFFTTLKESKEHLANLEERD